MYANLSQIEYRVSKLAKIIGASREVLPTFGHSEQSGRPHVEVDSRGYHFVIAERGREFERLTTAELDELLYHIFQSITFGLASEDELEHRRNGQDFRRLLFQRQEDLLSQINPAWGERRRQEHAELLRRHPFQDR